MGEYADDYVDSMIDGWFNTRRPTRKRGFQSGTGRFMWRTQSGDVVAMRSMSTQHLQAAANVCAGKGNAGKLSDIEHVLSERVKNFFSPVDNP